MLLGPNGAGKTHLLGALVGLVPLTAGQIFIRGTPQKAVHDLCREIGAIFPGPPLLRYTAQQHLRVLASHAGLDSSAVDHAISIVGLKKYAKKDITRFYSGEYFRLWTAQALLGDPQIILIDGITDNIEAEPLKFLKTILPRLMASKKTIVLGTSSTRILEEYFDDYLLLDRGKLLTHINKHDVVEPLTKQRISPMASIDQIIAYYKNHRRREKS